MKRLLVLALLVVAPLVRAQELDIFDINDFVDPRDLGATITPDGGLTCPCQRLFVSRLITGAVRHYVDLFQPTYDDIFFADLATSYYTGRWQWNLKTAKLEQTTAFIDTSHGYVIGRMPNRKHALQIGRYFVMGTGDNAVALRAQLNASTRQYRQRRVVGNHLGSYESLYDSDAGFELDTSVPIFHRPFVTSIVYVANMPFGLPHSGSNALTRRRLTLLHRLPRYTIAGFGIDASLAAGAYQFREKIPASKSGGENPVPQTRTHWLRPTVLPSLEIVSPPIPKLGIVVHARYEPVFQQRPIPQFLGGGNVWQKTHQYALFVDRAVFAKSF